METEQKQRAQRDEPQSRHVHVPARLGLPVCHREPDVPPYRLWGAVREICREEARSGGWRQPCREPEPATF